MMRSLRRRLDRLADQVGGTSRMITLNIADRHVQDSALIDAGLDFALGENATAGLSYPGQFGDGVTDNAVKGRLTWLF